MKASILHKLFSALLSLLVLFSTLSVTVEKHFCGDTLIGTSVFSEVEKCCSDTTEIVFEKLAKNKCCKDVIDVVEGQDELQKTSFEDLEFEQQQFVLAYVTSYISLFEGLPQLVIPHKDYSPPDIIKNIQVLDEVFLI